MSEVDTKEAKEAKRPVLLQDSADPKAVKPKDEEKGFWRRTWESWRSVVIVVAALMVVRSVVADWNDVPTGSMKPTIVEGDRIFVNKLAYGLKVPFTTIHLAHWNTPQRGEIVVFNSPEDGTRLVKRVVGLPGDEIALRNNELYINGQHLTYSDLNDNVEKEQLGSHDHSVMLSPLIPAMRDYGPKKVPAGEYFMMGDNRDNSKDSRYIGFVPLDNIVGRSSCVVLSLNYDNYYIPRWNRFFTALP